MERTINGGCWMLGKEGPELVKEFGASWFSSERTIHNILLVGAKGGKITYMRAKGKAA